MKFTWIWCAWFFVLGCVKTPTVTTPSGPLPVPTPSLEKTFGEISFRTQTSFQINYKSISLTVNPTVPGEVGVKLSADYVLFTSFAPNGDTSIFQSLDPSQKIVVPPAAAQLFLKNNFSQTKGLQNNQKILLKKDDAFLFVTAIQGRNAAKNIINGYCLEFDNGRNLLITGGIEDETVLRPFLYDLRDDGKEIYLALISGDAKSYVDVIALFQPKTAVVLEAVNLEPLRQPLADALYQGQLMTATPNQKIPF